MQFLQQRIVAEPLTNIWRNQQRPAERGANTRYRVLRKGRFGPATLSLNLSSKMAQIGGLRGPASDPLTIATRTCESGGGALAAAAGCAYRSSFNDDCAETLIRPQQTALVGDRGAFPKRHFRPPRPCRGIRRTQSPGRKEAHLAARSHADKPVF